MKRLIPRGEEERKAKKKQIIIGVSLAFIMTLSVLGFALQGGRGNQDENSSDKVIHNGFEFTYINGLWVIDNFAFRYNPEQVPDIGFGLKDATLYQGFPAYIYSESSEAETEAGINLRLLAERVQRACINEEGIECSEDLPIKTCEDNLIIIRENNISSIRQENNCVYIEGQEEELVELVDQFLFKILRIR
jgi:hypothetical protein